VRFAQRRRDDQRRELATDDVLAGVAQRRLGGRVEVDHPTVVVHRDDAVQGRRHDRRAALLSDGQCLLGSDAGDVLPDLVADRAHELELRRVRLALRAAEELHHPVDAGGTDHRDYDGRAQRGARRGARAREVDIAEVGDPVGLAGLPHAAGQADPGAKVRRRLTRVNVSGSVSRALQSSRQRSSPASASTSHSRPTDQPSASATSSSSRRAAYSSVPASASTLTRSYSGRGADELGAGGLMAGRA
jgi:hypothetical protein